MKESLDVVARLAAATSERIEETIAIFERLTGLQVCFLFKSRIEHNSDYKAGDFLKRIGHRSEFCTLIKAAPNSPGCKFYDHEVRMQKAEDLGQPYVDACPAGAVELVLPSPSTVGSSVRTSAARSRSTKTRWKGSRRSGGRWSPGGAGSAAEGLVARQADEP